MVGWLPGRRAGGETGWHAGGVKSGRSGGGCFAFWTLMNTSLSFSNVEGCGGGDKEERKVTCMFQESEESDNYNLKTCVCMWLDRGGMG